MTEPLEDHKIVSENEWVESRKALLKNEKEFTILRDKLSQQRRDLPWVAVNKEYIFEGPNGKQTLSELFDGRSQLIVYHFMFDPDLGSRMFALFLLGRQFQWYNRAYEPKDVTMIAVSRAPYRKLAIPEADGLGFQVDVFLQHRF